jgi:hypothetical protein
VRVLRGSGCLSQPSVRVVSLRRQIGDPVARKIGYWEYDRDEVLTCPDCGWSGRAGDNVEYHSAVFDVTCRDCEKMLVIVRVEVDLEETREAAEAGHPEAIEALAKMEAHLADKD